MPGNFRTKEVLFPLVGHGVTADEIDNVLLVSRYG